MIYRVTYSNFSDTSSYFSHTLSHIVASWYTTSSGQLFDAHGPSFTNKANHSSKGHGIDSTATGVGTSPIHTKKEIEKEAARKKLLLWREIKEKELQAELKAQQLLLQQEKTERLRFLQEQQRKREQIKKWRDAEVQLKDERELAERQARQVSPLSPSLVPVHPLNSSYQQTLSCNLAFILSTNPLIYPINTLLITLKTYPLNPPSQPPTLSPTHPLNSHPLINTPPTPLLDSSWTW